MTTHKLNVVILLFLIAGIMGSCCDRAQQKKPESAVEKYGNLSVKGVLLTGEKGDTVVLRGISLCWHNWWYDYYNANVVKTLSEKWNSTLIRAAIGVEPEMGYLSNPELALQCATTVADAAIKEGIYVISTGTATTYDWMKRKHFLQK